MGLVIFARASEVCTLPIKGTESTMPFQDRGNSQLSAHYLSGLVNVLVVLVLLFLGLGPRRSASLVHMTWVKLAPAGGSARALAKRAGLVFSLVLWR